MPRKTCRICVAGKEQPDVALRAAELVEALQAALFADRQANGG